MRGLGRLAAIAALFMVGVSPAAAPVRSDGGAAAGAAGVRRPAAVIVQAPGVETEAAAAVRRLGGSVTRALPIVSGFAAVLPAGEVERLAAHPGVRAVTTDGVMRPMLSDGSGKNLQTVNSVFTREIGADTLVASGFTGQGVTVALIDTGVDRAALVSGGELAGRVVPVTDPMQPPGLAGEQPTVECVDFSGEQDCDDTFGHGTFMAGLIAGSGAASGGRFAGVAPQARIVSIKVGGRDGSADVSKVLAAIQWAVSFRDAHDIKVLNLSLGTDSTVPPEIDPLNLAVQRAWVSGITVVISAGNFGPGPRTRPDGTPYGTVTKPGDDPYVITVGAVDDRETPAIDDDSLPLFSSWGPTFHGEQKPDVAAPGGRVVSLRAKQTVIDGLPGHLDDTYRRGSGTSMAAAITSGLVALLLDARDGADGRPAWRPDDVKAALIAGAHKVNMRDGRAVGAGLVHGPTALAAVIAPAYRTSVLFDPQRHTLGTLDGSRGSNVVEVACRAAVPILPPPESCREELRGEQTAQGNNWQSGEYATGTWDPQTWYESQWVRSLGNSWQGNNWQATTWAQGNNWQGNNWQGSMWNGQTDNRSYGQTIKGSGSYGAWGS